MPWLDDIDLRDAHGLSRSLRDRHTVGDVRDEVAGTLARIVPSDLLCWDSVALGTGTVEHDAAPAGAEPPDMFGSLVRTAAEHPALAGHAHVRRRGALRLSDALDSRQLAHSELHRDLLHRSGADYEISVGLRPEPGRALVIGLGRSDRDFSERDRDLLNLVSPAIEHGLQEAHARERSAQALGPDAPPGRAIVLLDRYGQIERSSLEAERWLAEHFGPAEHPGWLPEPVASWLALPPRPPIVSLRDGRLLTIQLLPGEPHALLLEEQLDQFRPDTLVELGLTPREREVLEAARTVHDEYRIADELFLSPHAVRDRLERVQAKLGVRTGDEAVAEALRASA